ncbi:MAG: hypothetical protein COS40_08775, partial [Deltaproteobacteria bacterium CG03_land_8_20_14_0_80_45_14]
IDPASAEGMVKTKIKAKIKTINANFFHIKDPSFRVYLSFFHFFRRGGTENLFNGKGEINGN